VDITLREGWTLDETLAETQRLDEQRQAIGFDQKALDRAAKAGFANGAFEDSAEESIDVVEEFYPDAPDHPPGQAELNAPVTLADKLQAKSQQGQGSASQQVIDQKESETNTDPSSSETQHSPQRQAKRA